MQNQFLISEKQRGLELCEPYISEIRTGPSNERDTGSNDTDGCLWVTVLQNNGDIGIEYQIKSPQWAIHNYLLHSCEYGEIINTHVLLFTTFYKQ